jgi:hypothetical protein
MKTKGWSSTASNKAGILLITKEIVAESGNVVEKQGG